MPPSQVNSPSLLAHFRDILILPTTVTVVIPYFIHDNGTAIYTQCVIPGIVGAVIGMCGLALLGCTVYLFRSVGKGTLAPWDAPRRLVIRGPYRYCRNPMITGVLCILIGESLIFNSLPILIWTCFFFCINTLYFVLKEEPDLSRRFGKPYADYKRAVPRWIPTLKPYRDRNSHEQAVTSNKS